MKPTVQPPWVYGIDRSTYLGSEVVLAWCGSNYRRSYVANTTVSYSSTLPIFDTIGKDGRGARFDATAVSYLNTGATDSILPTDRVTVLLHWRKTDGTNRASSAFGVTDGIPSKFHAHLPYSDGTVYWDWVSDITGRTSVGGLTFGNDVWVFTAGPRGGEIWQNGLLQATGATVPSPTRTATGSSIFLGQGILGPDNAESALFVIFKQQLPAYYCRQLGLNPWQIFLPSRRQSVPFIVAAGGGGNTATVAWWT